MRKRSGLGFTLIELILAVSVAGIMLALAMPTMSTWLANSAIRVNAEAVSNAIQYSRAEALRRNTAVQMVIDTAGTSWTIREVATGDLIQQRDADGRANTVNITFEPAAARTLTFSGLGTITDSTPIVALKVDSSTLSAAQSREMCVMVTVSGASRMCDPFRATGNLEAAGATVITKDPQSCQPAVPTVCIPTP